MKIIEKPIKSLIEADAKQIFKTGFHK